MKPSYTSIAFKNGIHKAGIISIEVVPKEWLVADVTTDFLNSNISLPITLLTGKSFIKLEFTHQSYLYDEKPKVSKNGLITEVTISGILNQTNPITNSVLQTLRYHELVAIVTDVRKQKRIVGNKTQGLSFSFASKNSNLVAGSNSISVEMVIDLEEVPPYYLYVEEADSNYSDENYFITEDGIMLVSELNDPFIIE